MKMKTPKIAKPHISTGRPPSRLRPSHTAFPVGGSKAFDDPATMQAPDQAFGAAMAVPQVAPESTQG